MSFDLGVNILKRTLDIWESRHPKVKPYIFIKIFPFRDRDQLFEYRKKKQAEPYSVELLSVPNKSVTVKKTDVYKLTHERNQKNNNNNNKSNNSKKNGNNKTNVGTKRLLYHDKIFDIPNDNPYVVLTESDVESKIEMDKDLTIDVQLVDMSSCDSVSTLYEKFKKDETDMKDIVHDFRPLNLGVSKFNENIYGSMNVNIKVPGTISLDTYNCNQFNVTKEERQYPEIVKKQDQSYNFSQIAHLYPFKAYYDDGELLSMKLTVTCAGTIDINLYLIDEDELSDDDDFSSSEY
jgi:hypothetical protein